MWLEGLAADVIESRSLGDVFFFRVTSAAGSSAVATALAGQEIREWRS